MSGIGNVSIKPDGLRDEVMKALEDFEEDTQKKVNKATRKVAKNAADKLKQKSPVRSDGYNRKHPPGSYAQSWAVKNAENNGGIVRYVVHNKKHYMLTHLLEFGHINAKTGRRVSARPHIASVEQQAIKEMEEAVKQL